MVVGSMGNGKGSRTTVYSIKCRHKVTIIAQQLLARRKGGGGQREEAWNG